MKRMIILPLSFLLVSGGSFVFAFSDSRTALLNQEKFSMSMNEAASKSITYLADSFIALHKDVKGVVVKAKDEVTEFGGLVLQNSKTEIKNHHSSYEESLKEAAKNLETKTLDAYSARKQSEETEEIEEDVEEILSEVLSD
jgi:hypothetical protein